MDIRGGGGVYVEVSDLPLTCVISVVVVYK